MHRFKIISMALICISVVALCSSESNIRHSSEETTENLHSEEFDFSKDEGVLYETTNNVPEEDEERETESGEVFESVSFIPESVQKLCYEIGEEYHIVPELLIAIIEVESGGDTNAKNKYSGCMGLMQIHPKYAEYYLDKSGGSNPYSAEDNIRAGCEILTDFFERYTDVPLVVMKYHGEKNAVSNYRNGRYSEYCKNILNRIEEMIGE